MKRFQTKKRRKKYTWIVLFIIFIVLFSLLSMFNLNKNVGDSIILLLEKEEFNKINFVNYFFNNLYNSSMFLKKDEIINNYDNTIKINGHEKVLQLLEENLKKIGINSQIDQNPFIKILLKNEDNVITVKNKTYFKFKVFLPQNYYKYKELINEKYQDFIIDIAENDELIIEINGSINNLENLRNSTEIVSLIIYNLLGD